MSDHHIPTVRIEFPKAGSSESVLRVESVLGKINLTATAVVMGQCPTCKHPALRVEQERRNDEGQLIGGPTIVPTFVPVPEWLADQGAVIKDIHFGDGHDAATVTTVREPR